MGLHDGLKVVTCCLMLSSGIWGVILMNTTEVWESNLLHLKQEPEIHVNLTNLKTSCAVYLSSRKTLNGHRN